jgi:hypothetical protein
MVNYTTTEQTKSLSINLTICKLTLFDFTISLGGVGTTLQTGRRPELEDFVWRVFLNW